MNEEPEGSERSRASWPPMWSIGLAAAMMLTVPAIMYSSLPEGPIRVGDTVFVNARYTVPLVNATQFDRMGYDTTCVVERRDPLVIIWQSPDRAVEAVKGQVQGKTKAEFPFCPPHAEILIKPGQVFQKPDLWSDLKESAVQLLRR